jgi:Tfp pilus assembly protein PilF
MRHFNLQLILLLLLTACTVHAQEPVSADDFSQRGISRFEQHDFEGAIADFTKAIELKGQQLEYCYYFRGMALYRRGRTDEAIADLGKAITLKQHPRFYADRGSLLVQRGDLDGGMADLNKAIELDPKFAKAYGDRGIVHLMRGEDTTAESDFRKCFELDKTLEFQFKATAKQLRQQAILRAEHQKPTDVEIVNFNWTETAGRSPNVDAPPLPNVYTMPVRKAGIGALEDPTAKTEPGPKLPPFDPVSPAPSASRPSVRGVEYKFTVLIKNTGSKKIATVHWAYFFVPQEGQEAFAYVFTTKIDIPPGKEKTLRDQVQSVVVPANQSKAPSANNRAQFKERVVIVRLEYADGSSWRSSGNNTRQ